MDAKHNNLPRPVLGFFLLFLVLLWIRTDTMVAAKGNILVFPQFVNNGGYITTITLANTNYNSPITGTLTVYNQNGALRSVALAGQPNPFEVTIPPGGTVTFSTALGGGPAISGMAVFVSDFPAGGVVQFQFAGGQIGVLDIPKANYATLPLNTANGNDTGLAISNSSGDPVNIQLSYVDANGQVQETISPPELNPLPANGQVANFVENFPFHTSLSNKSSGSVQILTTAATGSFHAFGLLFNTQSNLYASTSTVLGAKGHNDPRQWAGSYTGRWNVTGETTSGPIQTEITFVESSQVVFVVLNIDARAFGGRAAYVEMPLVGTMDATGVTLSGNTDQTGLVQMIVAPDGSFTMRADNPPDPDFFLNFRMSGFLYSDRITATYTVNYSDGTSDNGTCEMTHTNQLAPTN